ncbi:hypothetical protein [Desulfitibacter alkalitolerans]|nr:hypothetical protein [Desulfitibacter alkalitolerans]
MIWGVVFGVGVVAALVYYVQRQSKDPGYNMFPHNVIERTNLTEENN